MTLVALFATNDFAVAVADRRRTNMQDMSIQFDDVTKIRSLHDAFLVGHSGDYYIADHIIDETMKLITPTDPLERVAQIYQWAISNLISQGVNQQTMSLTFHLAGKRHDGTVSLARISEYEAFQIVYTPIPPNGIQYCTSIADVNPVPWIAGQLREMKRLTAPAIAALGKRMVKRVSRQDRFVSAACDILSIPFPKEVNAHVGTEK